MRLSLALPSFPPHLDSLPHSLQLVVVASLPVHRLTGKRNAWDWDAFDHRQGPESPFPEKEGFGVPHFPSSWTREFSPLFSLQGTTGEMGIFDRKLTFPACVRAKAKIGPRNPLFRKRGFRAPVWGRGNHKHGTNHMTARLPVTSKLQGRMMNGLDSSETCDLLRPLQNTKHL